VHTFAANNLANLKLAERFLRKDVLTFAQTMHDRWLGKRVEFVASTTTVSFILKLFLRKNANALEMMLEEAVEIVNFIKSRPLN
jgi:hypothetical protein